MYNYYVGIDISQDFFDISLINEKEEILLNKKFDMNIKGFELLEEVLSNYSKEELLLTMESTGIYHFNLLEYLSSREYKVSSVNPLKINAFIKSISLRKTKTDEKDAVKIAIFSKKNKETLVLHKKEDVNNLKSLVRERETLVEEISKVKTQIKTLLSQSFRELNKEVDVFSKSILNILLKYPSINSIQKAKEYELEKILNNTGGRKVSISAGRLKELANESIGSKDENFGIILVSKIKILLAFEESLEVIEQAIDKGIKKDENLSESVELLESIAGIGNISAKIFVAELGNIDNFSSRKKLSAYIGIDPGIKQSGKSINVNGRISKKGNKYLRKKIYLMAISVVKYNTVFKEYFLKKKSEGKKYKQAIIAVANKLIRLIFSILLHRRKFEPTIIN